MDMPVIVEIVGESKAQAFETVFDYFHWVDNTFSTFKSASEISKINDGRLPVSRASREMLEIFRLAEQTKRETDGFFDITRHGKLDPSGIVKGWAIHNAALLIKKMGHNDYYVEVGGDIEVSGHNADGKPWTIGIRNPFAIHEIVKIVHLINHGIATSGTYERGKHIYNPKTQKPAGEIASITVIGPNVYEADRFATAAFAMGNEGIRFIGKRRGLEGYMIDTGGIATFTDGFEAYTI